MGCDDLSSTEDQAVPDELTPLEPIDQVLDVRNRSAASQDIAHVDAQNRDQSICSVEHCNAQILGVDHPARVYQKPNELYVPEPRCVDFTIPGFQHLEQLSGSEAFQFAVARP